MFLRKLHHARDQVADAVGEVGGVELLDALGSEVSVFSRGHVSEQDVAQRVNAIPLNNVEGVNDVANGLAHLLSARVDEAVIKDVVGGLYSRRHKHRLPHQRLEAYLVLPRHLERRSLLPKLLKETLLVCG